MIRLLPVLFLCACEVDPCEHGSMLYGEEGLVVVSDEHGEGWGRSDCTGCHSLPALHRYSCTEGIDMAQVREEATDETTCATCHGDNGVTR